MTEFWTVWEGRAQKRFLNVGGRQSTWRLSAFPWAMKTPAVKWKKLVGWGKCSKGLTMGVTLSPLAGQHGLDTLILAQLVVASCRKEEKESLFEKKNQLHTSRRPEVACRSRPVTAASCLQPPEDWNADWNWTLTIIKKLPAARQ